MLQHISDDVHPGQSVNPAENTDAVKSVDYVDGFQKYLWKSGQTVEVGESRCDGWKFDKISTKHGRIDLSGSGLQYWKKKRSYGFDLQGLWNAGI